MIEKSRALNPKPQTLNPKPYACTKLQKVVRSSRNIASVSLLSTVPGTRRLSTLPSFGAAAAFGLRAEELHLSNLDRSCFPVCRPKSNPGIRKNALFGLNGADKGT